MMIKEHGGIDAFTQALQAERFGLIADIGPVTINTITSAGEGSFSTRCTDGLGTEFNALVIGQDALLLPPGNTMMVQAQQIKSGNLLIWASPE